jgi:hypothetical protein
MDATIKNNKMISHLFKEDQITPFFLGSTVKKHKSMVKPATSVKLRMKLAPKKILKPTPLPHQSKQGPKPRKEVPPEKPTKSATKTKTSPPMHSPCKASFTPPPIQNQVYAEHEENLGFLQVYQERVKGLLQLARKKEDIKMPSCMFIIGPSGAGNVSQDNNDYI